MWTIQVVWFFTSAFKYEIYCQNTKNAYCNVFKKRLNGKETLPTITSSTAPKKSIVTIEVARRDWILMVYIFSLNRLQLRKVCRKKGRGIIFANTGFVNIRIFAFKDHIGLKSINALSRLHNLVKGSWQRLLHMQIKLGRKLCLTFIMLHII